MTVRLAGGKSSQSPDEAPIDQPFYSSRAIQNFDVNTTKDKHVSADDGFTRSVVARESPNATALLYALTLSMLHFTFDVLVYNQYAQSIVWSAILLRSAVACPIFAVMVFIVHTGPLARHDHIKQATLLVFASTAACYLVKAANHAPYLAVMKIAPPLGALWIWAVVEMRLIAALVHLSLVTYYARNKGLSLF